MMPRTAPVNRASRASAAVDQGSAHPGNRIAHRHTLQARLAVRLGEIAPVPADARVTCEADAAVAADRTRHPEEVARAAALADEAARTIDTAAHPARAEGGRRVARLPSGGGQLELWIEARVEAPVAPSPGAGGGRGARHAGGGR